MDSGSGSGSQSGTPLASQGKSGLSRHRDFTTRGPPPAADAVEIKSLVVLSTDRNTSATPSSYTTCQVIDSFNAPASGAPGGSKMVLIPKSARVSFQPYFTFITSRYFWTKLSP